jgi:hypothetical protein
MIHNIHIRFRSWGEERVKKCIPRPKISQRWYTTSVQHINPSRYTLEKHFFFLSNHLTILENDNLTDDKNEKKMGKCGRK